MKKLGLLIVGAYALVACDATPGGNKSIYPVEYEGHMEQIDHHNHEEHTNATHAEKTTDSTQVKTEEAAPSTEVPPTEAPAETTPEAGH